MPRKNSRPKANYRFILTRSYSVNATSADEAYKLFKDAAYDFEFGDDTTIVVEHVTRLDPVDDFSQKLYYLDDDNTWVLVDDRPA